MRRLSGRAASENDMNTQEFAEVDDAQIQQFEQDWLKPKTDIPGLYLTGQDIVSCGIAGALISAVVTSSVMNRRNMIKEIASA